MRPAVVEVSAVWVPRRCRGIRRIVFAGVERKSELASAGRYDLSRMCCDQTFFSLAPHDSQDHSAGSVLYAPDTDREVLVSYCKLNMVFWHGIMFQSPPVGDICNTLMIHVTF